MIYTVGHRINYQQSITDSYPAPIVKLGRTESYTGGIVFQTPAEARQYLTDIHNSDWGIWGLSCDWDNTYEGESGKHYLIVDTPIVPLSTEYCDYCGQPKPNLKLFTPLDVPNLICVNCEVDYHGLTDEELT